MINTKQLCKLLNISDKTAYNWREYENLPYIRLGPKKIQYDEEAVMAWVKRHEVLYSTFPKNKSVNETFHDDINKATSDSIKCLINSITEYTEASNEEFLLKILENKDLNNTEATIDELTSKIKAFMLFNAEATAKKMMLMQTLLNKNIDLFDQSYNYYPMDKTHEELEIKIENLYCDFQKFLRQIIETLQNEK